MSTFVAIDFETADPKRDSACAIGLVRVEGGRIVYRESSLIRPPRGMSPMNQAVHGLTYDAVKSAPTFGDLWPKLLPILTGATFLVAHNASFDRSVLKACCCVAGIEAPVLPWECTLDMAKKKWPKPASHKLPDVCRYLSIELKQHHEAAADAEAAAIVYLALTGAPAVAPPEPPEGQPAWVPSGECGEILDEIPHEYRTPSVIQLMRDAEQLGPAHAADLVRTLGRWFTREEPGPAALSGLCAAVRPDVRPLHRVYCELAVSTQETLFDAVGHYALWKRESKRSKWRLVGTRDTSLEASMLMDGSGDYITTEGGRDPNDTAPAVCYDESN